MNGTILNTKVTQVRSTYFSHLCSIGASFETWMVRHGGKESDAIAIKMFQWVPNNFHKRLACHLKCGSQSLLHCSRMFLEWISLCSVLQMMLLLCCCLHQNFSPQNPPSKIEIPMSIDGQCYVWVCLRSLVYLVCIWLAQMDVNAWLICEHAHIYAPHTCAHSYSHTHTVHWYIVYNVSVKRICWLSSRIAISKCLLICGVRTQFQRVNLSLSV